MNTVDLNDILALLEDGPKKATELHGWIGGPRWAFFAALATFAAQGAIERTGYGKSARWSLPGSTSGSSTTHEAEKPEAPPVATTVDPPPVSVAPAQGITLDSSGRLIRRVEDEEFEIIWGGVGPLPGSGTAAGLGSTLSGNHFNVGKRV